MGKTNGIYNQRGNNKMLQKQLVQSCRKCANKRISLFAETKQDLQCQFAPADHHRARQHTREMDRENRIIQAARHSKTLCYFIFLF